MVGDVRSMIGAWDMGGSEKRCEVEAESVDGVKLKSECAGGLMPLGGG